MPDYPIMTNKNRLSRGNVNDEPRFYQFRVIAEFADYLWVQPLNGLYVNEGPVTFHKDSLEPFNQ